MKVRTGIDIIDVAEIESVLNSPAKLKKMLSREDLQSDKKEHIAGRIALKEATIKATNLTVDDWLNIRIRAADDGSPEIEFTNKPTNIISIDGSISHHKGTVVAMVVVLYKDN